MKFFKKTFIPAVGALVLTALFSAAIFAQDEKPKSQLMSITTIKVIPQHVPAFEEMIKNEYNPAFVKGGGATSEVWQMAVGNGFEYVFVQPMKNFAAMDSPSPLSKGLGEDKMKTFYEKVSKMVTDVSSVISRTMPDMTYAPEMKGPPNVAVVIYITAHPGKTSEIEKFVKEHYLPVSKKANAAFWASRLTFGGNTDQFVFLEPQENFAALDKGPPASRVLKPAEMEAMYAKIPNGAIRSVEVKIAKFQPKLSVMPKAEMAEAGK